MLWDYIQTGRGLRELEGKIGGGAVQMEDVLEKPSFGHS